MMKINNCKIWKGCKDKDGYGVVKRVINGKKRNFSS